MKRVPAVAAALFLSAAAVPAMAQTTPAEQPAVPDAAAAITTPAAATPICTDRPTKAYVACTVPKGDLQIETDVINWTTNQDSGTRTDVVFYTNPTLKYGIGSRTDLELNISPYETVRVRGGGDVDRIGGVGDLYVRLKQQLVSGPKTNISLVPYVKAPIARSGIGNRTWEGGIAAPIVFSLPKSFTLDFSPEVDVLADGDLQGHHAQFVTLVNLGKSIGKATIYGEFWNAQNFDPAGTVHQYSADVAVAYLFSPVWQIDLGGNFGLNRYTPDAQVYFGLSTRF